MEVAREAMIRAHKAASYPTEYKVGDKVKISTDALPVRCPSTVSEKLQPKYIGPFTVLGVRGKVLHLQMPKAYSQVHDKFNIEQVRPWLHSGDNTIDPDLPDVEPHPALNPVVQTFDRKKFGRPPKNLPTLFDIPTQYLVVYRSGATAWVRRAHLRSPEEKKLIKAFEFRFKRRKKLPCNAADEDPVSDDELDLGHYQDVESYYGSDSD
jgi:hypothetical protein